jgi:hypothetical protein
MLDVTIEGYNYYLPELETSLCCLQIETGWQDYIEVHEFKDTGIDAVELLEQEHSFRVETDAEENMCYISAAESDLTEGSGAGSATGSTSTTLRVTVPELCDTVHVVGNEIHLRISNKVLR